MMYVAQFSIRYRFRPLEGSFVASGRWRRALLFIDSTFFLVLDVDLNTFQLLPSPNGTGEFEIDSGEDKFLFPSIPLCLCAVQFPCLLQLIDDN